MFTKAVHLSLNLKVCIDKHGMTILSFSYQYKQGLIILGIR